MTRNCRHSFFAFIPGYSVPTYTEEQLREMEEQDKKTRTWNGKQYNTYEATQKQRQMETTMRAQREKITLLKKGGADQTDIAAAQARYLNSLRQYQGFSKRMELPEQMERVYMDGLGRVLPGRDFKRKSVAKASGSGIMKSTGGMARTTGNKGAFSHLSERMSKKHIRELAKKFDIDLDGISLNIDANKDLLRIPFAGRADSENIGGITFFPNAFRSQEELLRTLYHEKQHVLQFREYGAAYVQENRAYFESLTETLEEDFIRQLKKEGKL